MKCLFVNIESGAYSAEAMREGFRNNGYEVIDFKWQIERFNNGLEGMRINLFNTATSEKPDLIFLHIQLSGVISTELAKSLQAIATTVQYTFDVRSKEESEWMYDIAKVITHSFFACQEDVNNCKELGITKTSVLQSSFSPEIYVNYQELDSGFKKQEGTVCFIGTNYVGTNLKYPLAQERYDMVQFLKKNYGDYFFYAGMNWETSQIFNPQQEVNKYNTTAIAISQNNFEAELYTSDRLWRIIATGCLCITKYFKGIETIFERGVHLDWWHTFEELKSKIDYYLTNSEERERIAKAGMSVVRNNHTWTDRIRMVRYVEALQFKEQVKTQREISVEVDCKNGHTWNGITPIVDADRHEVQNKELVGLPCDCKRMTYFESLCGCSQDSWQVKLLENTNR